MIHFQSSNTKAPNNLIINTTALFSIHICRSLFTQSVNQSALAARVGVGALHEADGGARVRHPVPVQQGRVGLEAREEVELRADGRDPVVLEQAARVAALWWW